MKKLLDRLDVLIEQGANLREKFRGIEGKNDKEREQAGLARSDWVSSCEHVLKYAGMELHATEFRGYRSNKSYPSYQIAQLLGVIQSARNEIEAGLVGKLRYLVHADFFDKIIDQAAELHRTGHMVPAAVLGRIVIEQWIRDEAEKEGIPDYDKEKASVLNDALKKSGHFSVPKWRQVQSFLDVGNSAAHGKTSEFNADDVKRMLDFALSNCV